jgi:hypothetical protein
MTDKVPRNLDGHLYYHEMDDNRMFLGNVLLKSKYNNDTKFADGNQKKVHPKRSNRVLFSKKSLKIAAI